MQLDVPHTSPVPQAVPLASAVHAVVLDRGAQAWHALAALTVPVA